MIHEKLYQSTNLNRINISDYIKNLVYDLCITLASPWNIVKPTFDIDDISLNIETAAPCGLIINELVSNSIKYAFPPETEGKIYMSLKKSNQGCELIISDNGIGIPEDIDYKNTKSLGLQLVNNLVSQLNGEIKLERKEGTTFKITFKELKYKERF
jgi:two-component sensor histidine kinase